MASSSPKSNLSEENVFARNPTCVIKRDGYDTRFDSCPTHSNLKEPCSRVQTFDRDKFLSSLRRASWGLDAEYIDIDLVVDRILTGLIDAISTEVLLTQASTTAVSFSAVHPHYSLLAGRLYVMGIHKSVGKSFSGWVALLATNDPPSLHHDFITAVAQHAEALDGALVHARDFDMTYRNVVMLARSYLFRDGALVVERPQHAYMRVAVAIHGQDIYKVIETYNALSTKKLSFSSPFMFNAGSARPAFASCFLYQPPSTSHELCRSTGDLDAMWLADGGIGFSVDVVPARRTTPPYQAGVLSLLRLYDAHAQYTNLLRHNRRSAATAYIPIWHADVIAVVQSRSNRVPLQDRLSRIFPAVWVPDIFMERLEAGKKWSLFDPTDVPDLLTSTGDAFSVQYREYEQSVVPLSTIPCDQLWDIICSCQRETGVPFVLYADNVNAKNNQSHMGVVRSSNLCTEIVQVSSSTETAVCTLASISLPGFVRKGCVDFSLLAAITGLAVHSLDSVLDFMQYPTSKARVSALSSRAIGVGAQGLADVFMLLKLPFDSPQANALNVRIFETIYFAALATSADLARRHAPYPKWTESPASTGILQYDMWRVPRIESIDTGIVRNEILAHGLRNSMLTAQMPTASTAQLLGNAEGVEPYASNITTFRLASGDFTEFCPWLVKALTSAGLWSDDLRRAIVLGGGSVQHIPEIPDDIKAVFRTAWEIEPTAILDLAAGRGPYIDQSQSISLYLSDPTVSRMTSLHLYAWRRGLKTGVYYTRTKPPVSALPFGVSTSSPPNKQLGYMFPPSTRVHYDFKGSDEPDSPQDGSVVTADEPCDACSA